ncbi:hypothetical protein CB1_000490082 [Camelus ferus]|nr:hypothetical protein CB1_000490082 [Camelus ferus]
MADKGKKGKPGPAPAPGTAPAAAEPAPAAAKTEEKKEEKPKSVQPKDEVGTRKGCRRYRWEFKDSNREFWVMGHAEVKILSLQGCLIGSLIMFTGTTVHPLLTLIITMELSIFCFFIIVYTFAIQRYMPFILWPISDLLNDLFACGFLGWAVYFAVTSRQTMPLHYVIAVDPAFPPPLSSFLLPASPTVARQVFVLWTLRTPALSLSACRVGLSFITFICYVASSASAFLMAPLLEFLLALYFLFADAMQLNDKWQGLFWPMMDFLRCVTAALIYFAISITAVAKYSDGASKAAGVFGFFATIVFAIDFYLIFNDMAKFLKQGDSADETTADKAEGEKGPGRREGRESQKKGHLGSPPPLGYTLEKRILILTLTKGLTCPGSLSHAGLRSCTF